MEVRCKENCPCCESCKDCMGFQKILDLKNAGLVIYRHMNSIDEFNNKCGLLKSAINTRDDIFIVHNTKDKQIKAEECISEIDQGISCARCRELVKRAKKYLQDVPPIDKKDIISVCDHCQQNRIKKRSHYCCKCHDVLKKYHAEEVKQVAAEEQIKTWLSNANTFENKIIEKRTKRTLKCRSHSELYLNNICKTTFKTARPLEVRPMLDKGVQMIESIHSSDNDTKSESALKFSDSEYVKPKSVLNRANSLLRIGSYISPSVTTIDASLADKSGNKNEELKSTTLQKMKGILQKDSEFVKKRGSRVGKSPSTLKKYYSEEDIFLSATGIKDRDIGKNFSFIFPKEISDDVRTLRRVKTSAELILDTKEMLRQRDTYYDKNKYQAQKKPFTARKTRSEGTRTTTSDVEDSKKLVKKENSEERETLKKSKTYLKESKSDKEKVQKEQKLKKEPDSGAKDKTDQIRKEKEDKLQLLEEKKEKQERTKKGKEEKRSEKQEPLRKETEEKQLHKDEQQEKTNRKRTERTNEEKLKNKEEKIKKPDRVQIDPKQKPELLNMKKHQDVEALKINIEKKKLEEAERKLKALEGSKPEKKTDQEKPKVNKTQEEPTNKELSIKQIKMRMPSPDDLILQLVKIRQSIRAHDKARPKRLSEMNVTPFMINEHKNTHKGKKKINCAMCVDSDFELDVENIVNTKTKPEITEMIVGNKVLKSKLPLRETIQTEEMLPILFKTLYHEDLLPIQHEEHPQNLTNPKAQKSLPPAPNKYVSNSALASIL